MSNYGDGLYGAGLYGIGGVVTYSSTILADTPQVYYHLDETSGVVAHDSSGNGNNGTLSGVSGYNVAGISGSGSDTALSFTSAGQVIFPTSLTPSSWSTASLEFWVNDTTGWHHVVMTTTNSTGTTLLYLDGASSSSGSGGSILLDQLFDAAGSWTHAWSLDEVALYNYVLSSTQVATHYAAALSPPLTLPTTFTITIGGQAVLFDESTFQVQYAENERWRCQFTVLDYTGNQVFPYRSQVAVYDPVLNYLFTGFLIDDTFDRSNTMANVAREHKIDCIGNESKFDKRTSPNKLYSTPTPSVQVALDILNDVGAAEGVTAKYAMLEVNTQAEWAAGTLSGVVASNNLSGGDLELSPAGTTLTISEPNFNTGTLSNTDVVNNTLQLQSYNGLSMTATCIGNVGNARIYWALYTTNTTQTHDWLLEYTMWIDGSSPKIMAGVDVVYTDGSTLRGLNSNVGQFDQHGLGSHPGTDLKGWADSQWYSRTIGLYPFTGKTIDYISVAFEGDDGGNYGAYFQSIQLTYSSTVVLDVLGSFTGGSLAANNGYTSIKVQKATVYAKTGSRVSPSHDLTPVGIYQNSLTSWVVDTPTDTSFSLAVSLDNQATWIAATNRTAIAEIVAGSSLSGKTVRIKESMSLSGKTPLTTPTLSQAAVTLIPSYSSTQNDVTYTRTTTADWSAGTLTNLLASNNSIGLHGWWRDWTFSNITTVGSDQPLYGTATPSQTLLGSNLQLTTATGSDVRVRLDGAGNAWQNFTISVVVQIPAGVNGNTGFVYRTTGWQNANDTYGYVVTLSTAGIQLGHGTNTGSGGGAYTNISTAAIPLTAFEYYTLKVVVNGTSHTVYLDDVQYISATDATYTAAGYVGLRLWNTTGSSVTTSYGSFAILASLTGQYLSGDFSLNSVGTVGSSRFYWQDSLPGNSTALFETTIDGGSTWQTATSGQQIPQLPPGTNVVGKNLKVRITLTANSEQDQVSVQGYTAWITSVFSSSGSYISPSLSLASAKQVGGTLASWAALQPTNTSVIADTSIDGGTTWATNVAPGSLVQAGSIQWAGLGAIGGITTQPAPTTDDFSTNTSANYTSGNQTGGSAATWTFDTTNGRVTVAGGALAYDVSTGISVKNVDILVDMDYADAAGVVFCRSGASTSYSVLVHDASASSTPNTLTLFRNGASVASTTISFTRGLLYRLRATVSAGVITVNFDGTSQVSYTDGSPLVAGQAGLFTNGGTAHVRSLWLQPLGDDVSGITAQVRLRLSSTDPTATPQAQTFVVAAYGPQIGTGTLIPSADYRHTFASKNMDDSAKQSNYAWHIDQFNQLASNGSQAIPSPWVLQSNTLSRPSDIELDTNLAVETLGDLYRNRQTLTGVQNSAVFEDPFVGNGTATTFPLRYPIATGIVPTIVLNGVVQVIGLKGTAGSAFYYAEGDATIAQDANTVPLSDTDSLSVFYTGTFEDSVTVDNVAAQTALAPVEGGSGIVEAVEDVSSRNMRYTAAVTYANQLLTRYCITGRSVTFKTYRNGLQIGMTLPAWIPEEQLYFAQLLIHEITVTMQTQPNNTVLYSYVVQASELPRMSSFSKLIAQNLLN